MAERLTYCKAGVTPFFNYMHVYDLDTGQALYNVHEVDTVGGWAEIIIACSPFSDEVTTRRVKGRFEIRDVRN